uniref:Beta-hexosaminidase n=1 Tax=Clastoptera arizonana TaxID=38151 RepID=A0A1B6DW18_9HEMI
MRHNFLSAFIQIRLKTYLAILCILFVCTFYWGLLSLKPFTQHSQIKNRQLKFKYWEWICDPNSQQCKRRIPGIVSFGTSLSTCLMTCGPVQIWPLPTGTLSLSRNTFSFNHKQIKTNIITSHKRVEEKLIKCLQLLKKNIEVIDREEDGGLLENEVIVTVTVTGSINDVRYMLNTDETYRLLISKNISTINVAIHALTYLGARHGLETLSQLIWRDDESKCLKIIDKAVIHDSPYFTYRGLLLDTKHQHIPLRAIYRTLDGMAMNKLNVFHWYLPYSRYTGYTNSEVYTKDDVRAVTEYADLRGIRVSVEIDTANHTGFEIDYGDSTPCNTPPRESSCSVLPCENTNSTKSNTTRVVSEKYTDFLNLTGSDFIHIGGEFSDAVDSRCQNQSSEVTKTEYKNNGLVLDSYVGNTTGSHGGNIKHFIVWSKSFDSNNLNSSTTIIQSRVESLWNELERFANEKFRVIVSHRDKWYLDKLPHWTTVYRHRPWADLEMSLRDYALGGEACVWTHTIDEHSMDTLMWPQAAALAERLWSDPEDHLDGVMTRLSTQRERMVSRGIDASVLGPKWCLQNPNECN